MQFCRNGVTFKMWDVCKEARKLCYIHDSHTTLQKSAIYTCAFGHFIESIPDLQDLTLSKVWDSEFCGLTEEFSAAKKSIHYWSLDMFCTVENEELGSKYAILEKVADLFRILYFWNYQTYRSGTNLLCVIWYAWHTKFICSTDGLTW